MFFNNNRRKLVHEGKAKILYEGPETGTYIQYFKDDATAFNAQKKASIAGKGVLNNRISSYLMTRLEAIGIPTHFIKTLNMREQLIHEVEIIPIEVVVRNIAAGSLVKRLGLKEGTILPRPVIEFYFKDDKLGDPMIGEDHILAFGWADPMELEEIVAQTWRINDYLMGLFFGMNLKLVDMKLEFGRLWGENDELYVVLADEISPDNCRLWDKDTNKKLDKDRFREDLGDVAEAYQEVASRLGLLPKGAILEGGGINEQMAALMDSIENERAGERRLRAIPKTGGPSGPPKPTGFKR